MTYADIVHAFGPVRPSAYEGHPYTPSIASTASSSTSVFSAGDASSLLSSAASSVRSVSLAWENEAVKSQALALRCRASGVTSFASVNDAVPPELRLHPRRTRTAPQSGIDTARVSRVPPPLVRQRDRRDNFVENLVDTTSQMIEVIWPLSVVPCGRDAVLGGKNLIGLRTFIQEVLKRSKTSYSTLQVALYYLVLVKSRIPKLDFTKEQTKDSHALRAMQCGRRMFLAALILASKYLQDRNYSARAWSKISGLKVSEINSNEIAFVTAVDWNLHIPEPLFQRWTDVVLKYSLSAPPSPTYASATPSWRVIVARLTPALDTVDLDDDPVADSILRAPSRAPMSPPQRIPRSSPDRATSFHANSIAEAPGPLEPHPLSAAHNYRFPPISPKITQLPTPQLTPQSHAFGTPAAGATSHCPARSAMGFAMKHAQHLAMLRSSVDTWPMAGTRQAPHCAAAPASRLSDERSLSGSIMSSPDSMISDTSSQSSQSSQCSQSSRSSRSSSISSVTSSTGALPPPTPLAVQATRRYATMQVASCKNGITPCIPGVDLWTTVNPFATAAEESYIRGQPEWVSTGASGASHKSVQPPQSRGRKRTRPLSIADNQLQGQVHALLQCQDDDRAPHVGRAGSDSALVNKFLSNGSSILVAANSVEAAAHGSKSQISARKRVCCTAQSVRATLEHASVRAPEIWNSCV